jgi:hypothetical protein
MRADAGNYCESTDDQPRHLTLELPDIHAGGIVGKGKDGRRSDIVINILKNFARRKDVEEVLIMQGLNLSNLGYSRRTRSQ